MKKVIFVLFSCLLTCWSVLAQQNVIIQLNDGSTIRGAIKDGTIEVTTSSGREFTINTSEVIKLETVNNFENGSSNPKQSVATSSLFTENVLEWKYDFIGNDFLMLNGQTLSSNEVIKQLLGDKDYSSYKEAVKYYKPCIYFSSLMFISSLICGGRAVYYSQGSAAEEKLGVKIDALDVKKTSQKYWIACGVTAVFAICSGVIAYKEHEIMLDIVDRFNKVDKPATISFTPSITPIIKPNNQMAYCPGVGAVIRF